MRQKIHKESHGFKPRIYGTSACMLGQEELEANHSITNFTVGTSGWWNVVNLKIT